MEPVGQEQVDHMNRCPICLVEWTEDMMVMKLHCFNYFHKECLGSWLEVNGICPVCRRGVIMDEYLPDDDENHLPDDQNHEDSHAGLRSGCLSCQRVREV